jgi:hypothetical protein
MDVTGDCSAMCYWMGKDSSLGYTRCLLQQLNSGCTGGQAWGLQPAGLGRELHNGGQYPEKWYGVNTPSVRIAKIVLCLAEDGADN